MFDEMHVLIVDDVAPIRERLGELQGDRARCHVRRTAARLAPSGPDTRVLHVSGFADDAIVCRGTLEQRLARRHRSLTLGALARKVREVP
jgi:hypothetical protein